MELQDHGEEFSGYTTTAKLSVSSTKLSFDMIIEIVKLIKEEDLWNQIFRLLFLDVWSLPTLIKATAIINSLTTGVGTSHTIFLLKEAATVLGILYSIKPASESSSDVQQH